MLSNCCQRCAKCTVVHEIEHTMSLNESILEDSDVIFPIVGEGSVVNQKGFHFLPIHDAPTSYYFILRKSNESIIKEIIYACLDLWPFLVICLLFAFISGKRVRQNLKNVREASIQRLD